MKFYFVYVVHEVALKPPNCREITLESDVHDHAAFSFACTLWTFLSLELISGTVFFMHLWQAERSWCTWLCTDLVWRHQLLIMYQGTTTSLVDGPLSRTTWVSQYQEKTFIPIFVGITRYLQLTSSIYSGPYIPRLVIRLDSFFHHLCPDFLWSTSRCCTLHFVICAFFVWLEDLLLLFQHAPLYCAPLGVCSAIRRHQPPQRAVLSQVDCFVQCEVVGSQIALDGIEPRDTRKDSR